MACSLCIIHLVGVLLKLKLHHALGDETDHWFEDFVFKFMAGNKEGQWEGVVEETQALNPVESLAQIFQLKEKCYILKGGIETLK